MKKKASWWQNVLLLGMIAGLLFGAYQVEQVGNHLQYLIPAPAQAQRPAGEEQAEEYCPNQPVAAAVERLEHISGEWDTTMERWTVGGVIERANLSCNAGNAQARVELMGKDGLMLHPLYLREGRLFYPEEIEKGERLIILDEQLALAMFRIAYPIGRDVQLEGVSYRVIGIVRHQKRVGDLMDYGAYIPLNSVIAETITVDALQVEASPKEGVGASVSFKSVVQQWQAGGSLYDLGKEGMAAWLWLRLLLFVAGMTAFIRLIGWLNGRVRHYIKRYQAQLQVRYAVRLLPELLGVILLFALGYGIAAGLAALLLNHLIEPVYTFPEWVPAVLVEWADIADAFWKVWQLHAVMTELRTPEILRLRWLTLLIQGCSAGAAVLLALRYARTRVRSDLMHDSLTALYREGVMLSALRTVRPASLEELGYAVMTDASSTEETVQMLRIVHVQRLLQSLPAGRQDGSFVLEVTDAVIEQNNRRWLVSIEDGVKTVEETRREWDLRLPVEMLTRVVYGGQSFAEFLESNAGFEMKMHSAAMDGLFYGRQTFLQS